MKLGNYSILMSSIALTVSASAFAQDDSMSVLDEDMDMNDAVNMIELPEQAAEAAFENARGIDTANNARALGREFGQQTAEAARENANHGASDHAADAADNAADAAENASDHAADAADNATDAADAAENGLDRRP